MSSNAGGPSGGGIELAGGGTHTIESSMISFNRARGGRRDPQFRGGGSDFRPAWSATWPWTREAGWSRTPASRISSVHDRKQQGARAGGWDRHSREPWGVALLHRYRQFGAGRAGDRRNRYRKGQRAIHHHRRPRRRGTPPPATGPGPTPASATTSSGTARPHSSSPRATRSAWRTRGSRRWEAMAERPSRSSRSHELVTTAGLS